MINVIGLDLAMGVTGVSFRDSTAVTIDTTKLKGDARLDHIATQIRGYAEHAEAQLAVIEGPGRFLGNTGHIIGMVHGVARLELARLGIPVVLIPPDKLHKVATGNGKADKTAMAMSAYKRAGLEFPDHNACDAWWLRCAGLWATGHLFFDLPKAQLDVLKPVEWPELPAPQPDRIPAMLLTGGSFQAVCEPCGHMETAHPGGKHCIGNRNLCGCGEFRPTMTAVAS